MMKCLQQEKDYLQTQVTLETAVALVRVWAEGVGGGYEIRLWIFGQLQGN